MTSYLQRYLQTSDNLIKMYIPSLDMGEYDEYSSASRSRPRLPPVGADSRTLDRQPSRPKLDNLPRLPR